MPESVTSQSPQEVFSSSESEQWSQENNSNVVQNATNLEWNMLPNHNNIPVSSNMFNGGFIPNGLNGNVPFEYSTPPNYITIPNTQYYQKHASVQNGYPVISIPNSQNIQAVPIMVRPPQRSTALPNTWATPQNIKLIQTAWNKTSSGGVKKQKRVRTAFTSHQMMELEQEYSRTRYLDRSRRIELADMLQLNERTIKIWFQNRRMKEKKDRTESIEEIEDVSTTQSPSGAGEPMYHEQYHTNTEAYNRMGVFIEQYPVSSTSTSMTPMPQAQIVPGSYPTYAVPEECPPQYQQYQLQVQQYPSPYSEVQELSPESTQQSESSISVDKSVPSHIIEKSWDLSWIRSIEGEEEC